MEMEEKDLLEYWQIIVKRKWLIGTIFLITIGIVIMVSVMMEPVYEASTTLIVQKPKTASLASLDPVSSMFSSGMSNVEIQNQVEILKSRAILSQVVERMGWEPDALIGLNKKITIQPIAGTEILKISMQSTDKEEAQKFVNTLAEVYIEHDRAGNQYELREARLFLESQIVKISAELELAEEQLRLFKEEQGILQPEQQTRLLLEQQSNWDTLLAQTALGIIEIEESMAKIEAQLQAEEATIVSSQNIGNNPFVSQYRTRLADLEIALAGAKERYTDRHPEVLALQAEIQDVQKRLEGELERVILSETISSNPIHMELYGKLVTSQAELVALQSRQQALQTLRDQSDEAFGSLPKQELELLRLTRDVLVSEEIYLMLVKRYEEIRIQEAMQIASIRVLDPAELPVNPIKPRKVLNVAIGSVLGLFIGTGCAFLLDYIDTSVKTKDQVEALLGVPVLSQIPDFDQQLAPPKENKRFTRSLRM
ncbi:MAG: GumC family protein [Firmicutes bacterium]|nr:GumC family protein [Bacillota bacterium]